MAQNSWPFYSGSTGTPVLEDQWSIMARRWAQSGVESYANNLEVYGDSSGRQVKVKTGRATVRGHWYENTAEVTVAIDANSSGNPRIDRIVLKLDPSVDSIVLAVVKGTAAGSPSAPSLTQTDVAVYEMTLAQVYVANGASTITAGNVTDERTFVNGVWRTYTPTLTASTTNPTGWTQTGYYTQIGKLVVAKFKVTAGTGMTAGSGTYRIALPVNASTTFGDVEAGTVQLVGTGTILGTAYIAAATYLGVEYANTLTTIDTVKNNAPWTWANTHYIRGQITYEAA